MEAGSMIFSVAFNRMWAASRIHPMSGGIARKRIDNACELKDLRIEAFGFEHAPLPLNLELGAEEAAANKYVNIDPRPTVPSQDRPLTMSAV